MEYKLTKQDIQLCLRQCELQHAEHKIQINGMQEAFQDMKNLLKAENLIEEIGDVEQRILSWAKMIEPYVNRDGYRRYFVRVGLDESIDWQDIPRQMENWCEAYVYTLSKREDMEIPLSPTELYYEFEKIHPFRDGNGRTGHVIWALAEYVISGEWPTKLPPNVFGDPRIMAKETAKFNGGYFE